MSEQPLVLVVDDDHDIASAATMRLRAAGFRTLVAHDGEAGVALAAEHGPDVILLDVRMPRMNGLTALAELMRRADTCDIPVVMLSASIVDRQAAIDAGARFFLKKPYQGDTLVQTVTAAMNRPAVV
jgi:DNA-binding response OmpR family regulator